MADQQAGSRNNDDDNRSTDRLGLEHPDKDYEHARKITANEKHALDN